MKKKQFAENWKIKSPVKKCSVCGAKMKDWYDRCSKPNCIRIKEENIRKLIKENNRLEEERRSKPATIGDIEDAIKSLRDRFSSI